MLIIPPNRIDLSFGWPQQPRIGLNCHYTKIWTTEQLKGAPSQLSLPGPTAYSDFLIAILEVPTSLLNY